MSGALKLDHTHSGFMTGGKDPASSLLTSAVVGEITGSLHVMNVRIPVPFRVSDSFIL